MFLTRLSTAACALVLVTSFVACSKASTLTYTLEVRQDSPSNVVALLSSAERVIIRRLAALGEAKPIATVVPTGGSGGLLTISLAKDDIAPRVKEMIAEPFTFDIRLEKPLATAPTDENAGDASQWLETGIHKEQVVGVRTVVSKTNSSAAIEITFTPEGRALLQKLFSENKGKNIAIFVRDLMVSRLKIESDAITEHIVISGIPSATVGQIFSDDVNAGLYINYSPAQ